MSHKNIHNDYLKNMLLRPMSGLNNHCHTLHIKKMAANLTQILNFKANFHPEFELFSKKKIMLTMVDTLTLSDPGYFRQLTIRGGGL